MSSLNKGSMLQSKQSKDFSGYLDRNYGGNYGTGKSSFQSHSNPKSKMFSINMNQNQDYLNTNSKKNSLMKEESRIQNNQNSYQINQSKSSFLQNFRFTSTKPHMKYLKPEQKERKNDEIINKSNRQNLQSSKYGTKKGYKTNKQFEEKKFMINGINYYRDQIICDKKAQVLRDTYPVKGDYFYLKKGEIVKIRYVIGDYAQIKFQKMCGYFPSIYFKLL